ncbi:chitinase domain-containing protein 1-like isoform X2 [Vigna umbellata]|uniref:chitinase domain-containing protein 1-like isoform X2 n=1 Tax=Vigna umbellata TaxID=87088 RepID=UPI001F5E6FF5|nr:chitinase domain-containing protein 1-like isoform X2 [Vigna umbellata]
MAKKRSAPVGGRRENRVEPPPPQVNSASGRRNLVVFFIISSIIATVAYRFRQSSPPQYQELYVYEQGLVTIHANYQDVLTENSKVSENTSQRHYNYPVLGYITPWNSRGYELAKRFNSKFTHISPVWYDLKSCYCQPTD